MKTPLLSIIIPSYNYGRYLCQALDSILSQCFKDYEIILIDDGSTDESPAISKKYAQKFENLIYKRHVDNKGLFVRADEGLQMARGQYIHFFSADDIYLPSYLSKVFEIFKKNPEIPLICCDIGYFQDGSNTIETNKLLPDQKKSVFFPPEQILKVFQSTRFWVPGTSCIAKKEIIIKHDGYIRELENISDWFLYHRIALFEGIAYIPENLIAMRLHENTYSRQVKTDKKRRRKTYVELLEFLNSNVEIKDKFKESALLAFIFREMFWKFLFSLKYVNFWSFIKIKYFIIKKFNL